MGAPHLPPADVRVAAGTALGLLELAAEVLESLPEPGTALEAGDPVQFRYLVAARAARRWLVGRGDGDTLASPGSPSALGDGQRIFSWSAAETALHFREALRRLEGKR